MRYAIQKATIQQVRAVGGTAIREAPRTGIIFAELSDVGVTKLKALGCLVNSIGKTKAVITTPTPLVGEAIYTPQALIYAIGIEEVRGLLRPPLYGEGMVIAVIGTGIRSTHEQISGHVVYSENFTASKMEDTFDHDTGVASIILSVAPLCSLLDFKVLDENGEGTEEEVIFALEECMRLYDEGSPYRPCGINLSLGTTDTGDPSSPLRVACRAAALERGIWVGASAGNGGPNPGTITSPACEKYVGAIGSCSIEPFEISAFSSRGPTKEGIQKPDTVFFGENIEMASSKSDIATIAKSGTSFSCPFVLGMAAMFYEGMTRYGKVQFIEADEDVGYYPAVIYPLITPEEIDAFYPSICIKPQGVPIRKDNAYGHGLIWGTLVKNTMLAAVGVPDITTILSPIVLMSMLVMIIKEIK